MSGHSHWAGIKRKKAVVDAKRAQIFTKLGRAITIAAKNSGGNPDFNPSLRLAIDKAKSFNMPKDKIENSIKKGSGESSEKLFEVQYEALGPEGTMLIIETITDNKNRTVSDIRRILEKYAGKMADGGISWNFKRVGILELEPKEEEREKILETAIELDARDIIEKEDGTIQIISNLEKFNFIKESLRKYPVLSININYLPQNPISLNKAQAEKYDRLLSELLDHPDVQEVYDNIQESGI